MTDEEKPSTGGQSDGGYEVGFCKPPKHTQFKPGQSGNPRGRPKGTKNLKTDLLEELSEQVIVREGDRSKSVSKQRAFLKALLASALKGDVRAATLVMSTMMRLLDTGEGAPDIEEALDEQELAILEALEDRLKRPSNAPTAARADDEQEGDAS